MDLVRRSFPTTRMMRVIMVHHHKETFITKYVFSQDHKMICKQFLITGMIWAIIGGLMSVLFRLQLGYPDSTFPWLEDILGKWAKGGKIQPEAYYALVTMHGTVLVFFVLTGWTERNLCQLSDSTCRLVHGIWLLLF